MPVLPTPTYRPPFPFTSGHWQTIYPSLFRRTPPTNKEQERLITPDGDFLDIDWHHSTTGTTANLAIISHGLEGNSRKKYVLGMAHQLSISGWDVICFNFRGCSGETNKLMRFYHSGVTDDLHTVINRGIKKRNYKRIALVGFSMGGNQTLKYLGEEPTLVPPQVQAAVVFSVPCRLADSVSVMNGWQNRLYMHYFMKGLRQKVRDKAVKFPTLIDTVGLDAMKTFEPFDNKYTGPIHGFSDASDYYEKCSSAQFLHAIQIPTLIVQALDDPFLSASCYPVSEARQNPHLFLEVPQYGGHVGFMGAWNDKFYWSENRVVQFLRSIFN